MVFVTNIQLQNINFVKKLFMIGKTFWIVIFKKCFLVLLQFFYFWVNCYFFIFNNNFTNFSLYKPQFFLVKKKKKKKKKWVYLNWVLTTTDPPWSPLSLNDSYWAPTTTTDLQLTSNNLYWAPMTPNNSHEVPSQPTSMYLSIRYRSHLVKNWRRK